MANFNIGDRVNFLSSTGGGKVTKIIDSKMVLVEIEDGFELPCLTSDLVLDFRSQPTRQQQIVDAVQKEVQTKQKEEEEQREEARHGGLRRHAKDAEKEGVYLAFVPHDQQWMLTGPIDLILLNNTSYEMLYSLTIRETEKFNNADYGQIDAYGKVTIESISRDDLEYWLNGIVQAIFCKDESKEMLLPLNAPFELRPARFFKEGSYTMSGLLGEKAVMICLADIVTMRNSDEDFTRLMKEGMKTTSANNAIVKPKYPIDKHRTATGEAVVDLHIGELVDNIAGLSSHDMFTMQMDYFRKMLDSAIAADYSKVTFIHGVGNGVLKNAIIEELKHYKNTENRMASLAHFGVGAIDVVITERQK